ncbi:MAG: hypothetical protein GKS02_03965 [Alphaproteobacteria bacterium]|nr:hypothetical protein [Alphaproteobacteria bacterium]
MRQRVQGNAPDKRHNRVLDFLVLGLVFLVVVTTADVASSAQVKIVHQDGTVDEITTSGATPQIQVQQGDKIEVLNATLTSATVDGNNYVVTMTDPSGTMEITFVDLFLLLETVDPTTTPADAVGAETTVLVIGETAITSIVDALRSIPSDGSGSGDTSEVTDRSIKAARVFAGPDQYPPLKFAAYGIMAFPLRASEFNRDRHLMICRAYVAGILTSRTLTNLGISHTQQMFTTWPVTTNAVADDLNRTPPSFYAGVCKFAVDSYGLEVAAQALRDAELANVDTSGRGPYLLAWSPPSKKGMREALVLVSDLSNVTTEEQAQQMLRSWTRRIEQTPGLWRNGWNKERLRIEIRHWVDRYGPGILTMFEQ